MTGGGAGGQQIGFSRMDGEAAHVAAPQTRRSDGGNLRGRGSGRRVGGLGRQLSGEQSEQKREQKKPEKRLWRAKSPTVPRVAPPMLHR